MNEIKGLIYSCSGCSSAPQVANEPVCLTVNWEMGNFHDLQWTAFDWVDLMSRDTGTAHAAKLVVSKADP